MKSNIGAKLQGAALLLSLVPVAACAQPAQKEGAKVPGSARSAGVTLQAFVKRHEQTVRARDTDGDGKVSRAEFLAGARSGKGDPARRFAKIDINGDGMLDRAEIRAMLTRRFKRMDTNGDGVANADERTAAHTKKAKTSGSGSDS